MSTGGTEPLVEAQPLVATTVIPESDSLVSEGPLHAAGLPLRLATSPARSGGDTAKRRTLRIALWVATGWLVLIALLAVLSPVLPLKGPNAIILQPNWGPGFRLTQPLGTDNLGRSILSRIIYGGRVSLTVSVGGTLLALIVGVPLGLIGGYYRRFGDTIIDILVTGMLAFPPLILLIALTTILQPSIHTLVFSLGLLGIPVIARVARASTISVSNLEYVTAAKAMGVSEGRILFREILPNMLPSVLSYSLILAALLMVAEGSLSFLGIGIRPPTASWGSMVSSSIPNLATHPSQMLIPSLVFFFTVLALNTIGNMARARAERRHS